MVWAAQSGRADLVEQAIQWSWSSLRVPHLLDDVPISLLEEGRKWMDQPPLAHDLAAFRTCANRQQPIGTPD
ncbi:MAG: hypothetical protein D6690_14320 [Nitrospirae bacterium]|nr:MAG: hypothetical protein D6690_14320 [Nitrospirota bacterium]